MMHPFLQKVGTETRGRKTEKAKMRTGLMSEDEKGSLSTGPSVKRTKYVTRSKDPKKAGKENSEVKNGNNRNQDEVVREEDDEKLGGFIVNQEDDAMDELSGEEEFDDEDGDD
jgi:hypothetical protein